MIPLAMMRRIAFSYCDTKTLLLLLPVPGHRRIADSAQFNPSLQRLLGGVGVTDNQDR